MQAIEYTAEPHDTFDIFNDRYFGQGDSSSSTAGQLASSFPLWLDLPAEIRLRIWTWHLRQRRFLRVLLEDRSGLDQSSRTAGDGVSPISGRCPGAWNQRSDADQHEWTAFFSEKLEVAQDELEGPETEDHEDGPLRITFLDRPTSSIEALLLVCRESHKAYLSFYPIRLPALIRVAFRLSDRDGSNLKTRPIIAHLHPDLDTLSLQAVHAPDIIERNLLPLFLHTMIQHDASPAHKRFGTRNLCVDLVHLSSDYAFDTNEPKDTEIPGNVSRLPPEMLSSVRLSISHLRNLYFRLVTPHLEPRVMSGFLSGSGSLPWYNTSMPILPAPSWGFTAIVEAVEGVDPRLTVPEGIADLHQVWIGNQIRPSLNVWADQECVWGVRAGAEVACGTRVRALVGVDAQAVTSPELYHQSIQTALQVECTTWLSWLAPVTDYGTLQRQLFETAQQRFLAGPSDQLASTLTPEEWMSRRRSHTAVGFWLVDPRMLEAAKTTTCVGKKVADLSETGKKAIELWALSRR